MRQIRSNAWNTAFCRGWRAWLSLVAVCFLFSFIGASNASQVSFVDIVDRLTGTTDVMLPHNVDILERYFEGVASVHELPSRAAQLAEGLIDSATKSATWVIRLLALNPRYYASNPGEVLANVVVVAILTIVMRFVVQNVAVVGQHRYVMESRFSADVPWRRMLAPFHLHLLANVIWVMLCYHVTLLLWWLTVAGGVYKAYQYAMVPYLLAENPSVSWGDARRLSARMTDGHKWEMFLTQLSYLHIALLRLVPVLGLLVAVPLEAELHAEFYFALRANPELDRGLFVERAFDGPALVEAGPEAQATGRPAPYLLRDLDLERPREAIGPLPYPLVDLVYVFFAFCIAGWLWEVGLHFLQAHEFVNRGMLRGPWIPLYGVGGVGIVVLLDHLRDRPLQLFGAAVALCAVLEYACSFVLDFLFNASYWDYADMLFNLNGRICLAGLVAFGIGGLFGVYVAAPAVSRWAERLPARARRAGAAALVLAFGADLSFCLLQGFNTGSGVGEEL